ncbi:Ig-like domain-containing protein [Prosthecobacter sp.]|uniref:Ig-like domain-containing protein n=1 Tax=Prosthecobacter sp. TaxID=1965333 RepID=UPI002ABAAF1F|nr:Ig-like domain-containing protein [Prosthecobacter sp.]MDZ4401106.1 Ig-like domain-containing protein [Prosthecobacter sp.]
MKRLLLATLLMGTTARADVLSHEESDVLAAEAARLAPAAGPTATQMLPPVPAQYSTLGLWSSVIAWTPHIPVTCAQLPDGRLLTFASSQRTTFPVGNATYAATWDYRTGAFVEINNTRHDMFCGGVSLLKDGRLLVNGGNNTIRKCSLFDWRTNAWSAAPDMQDPRWYNTSVALPNGTIFTASGSGGSDTAERWQESSGWTRLTGINWALAHSEGGFESIWHPFLHVAPDGRIAHTGPTHTMHWVDPTGGGQFISTSATVPGAYYPKDGAVVMFDTGKILHSAGRTNGGGASNLAYVIDINGSTPAITQTGSLTHARTFANGVVLPNGEVMAIGGNSSQEKFSDNDSVMTPEIWNPVTGQWRTAANMQVPRNYHSLAVLLPDGRVWSGGGGLSGNSADHRDAQVYTPAALYHADGTLAARPAITEAPAAIGPGLTFNVRATAGLSRFTFIKLTSLTHSVTSDLRFLNLPFTQTSPGVYAVNAHANINVMTPGHWMLFAIAPNGVYSVSRIIQVDPAITYALSSPGDQTGTAGTAITPVTMNATGYQPATTSFSASGLPAGLAIHAGSGVISGTPAATGVFNVTITVNDGIKPASSTTFAWTIYSALTLSPLSHAPVPVGTAITFTASSTGGLNPQYKWNFGDGSAETAFSSSNTITQTFSPPGRYLVTLTARDDTGREVTTSFRQAVHAALTAAPPAVSSSIAYQVRSGANARLWVVNPDQDKVTVFDAVTRARSGIITTGKGPRSIAIAPDGRAWVVNSESGSITIIGTNLAVAQTVPLARGSRPYAIVFDPAGTNAYVSLQDTGRVVKINPATPTQIAATATVGSDVRHLSISADGTKVFATRFITPRLPGEETAHVITQQGSMKFGGQVVVITAASMSVAKTIILEHSNDEDSSITGRGIPNYLGPAVLSPDGISAWVPSKKDNIKRGMLRDGRPLTHDSTVRSITSRIDLTTEAEDFAARIDFNDAGIASTAAYERTGMYLFTALEGSREVAVVDAWGKRELLRFTAGRAPQGVITSPDGRTLYVHNFMDRTVTVHDVSAVLNGAETAPTLTATLNCITTEKLTAAVLKGKQFFYDSRDPRIALQQYVSCATCHNDGGQDGRVWDFTGFGEGLRNNISLKGHGTHGPVHWTGNFDEIQDFEGQMRGFAGGLGLMSDANFHAGTRSQPLGDPKAGLSADLDALAAYVTSLTTNGSSPSRNSNGTLTADAVAGQQIFRAQNCAACHSGTRFTNSALHVLRDVGTIKPSSGRRLNTTLPGFDVPTLRGLWNTAPYLHDGSAATLADAVRAHQGVLLTDAQLSQVVSFLSQIDDAVVSAPSPLNIVLATASSTVNTTFPVTGVLSEAATGFTAADISITGGTISGFAITGMSFSFNVGPLAANVRIEIAANVMTDATGLGNLASNVLNLTNTSDVTRPVITLATTESNVSAAFDVSLTSSENILGLTAGDFTVTNGTASNVTGSGSNFSATITPNAAGSVTVLLPAEAVADAAGNGCVVSNTLSVTFTPADTLQPTVTLATASTNVSAAFQVTATFSENVSSVALSDFIVTNGSVSSLNGSGSAYSVTVTPMTNGNVTIQLPANAASDAAGNTSSTSNTLDVIYTTTADPVPSVLLSTASSNIAGSFTVNAQFSENVTDVSEADFIVTNGHVTGLSGSGSLWIATIQPATTGDVTVRMPANAAQDSSAQGNSASNTLTVSFAPSAAFAAKINFQNAGAPKPNGYVADNGAVFAVRNGLEHGWNMDHSKQGRDRNAVSDQRQDTFIRMRTGARWEIAVPNGEYDLVISVGDATATSTNTLRVEGTVVWSALACAAGKFQVKSLRVSVADGRLTLDNGSAADRVTALNYIDIANIHGTPPTRQNGLTADYFAGINFDQLRFSRIDSTVDFRWDAAAPDTRLAADNFSVRWHGCIVPRHSERHTFTTMSDDGVRLWVNGQLLINNWTHHGEEWNTAEIDLQAGVPVTIQMEFYENGGDAVARLLWESTSQPLEVVPADRLLINETGMTGTTYPATFAAWTDSGRSNGSGSMTTAATNADGDDLPDLLEYALGGSAGSGINAGEVLRLDTQNGHVSASIVRPQGISDLHWFLESSTDLKTWSFLATTPAVIDDDNGTETLRWENLDTVADQSLVRGMVRLRVQRTSTGDTATTPAVTWQQITTQRGTQTIGVNGVNAPVFAGYAHSSAGNAVYITDASYLPGVVDPDARYYLEIRSGPHAGHRFDLAHIGDRAIVIDTESANNTLLDVPTDISGARIAIHKHVTLGQVFDKTVLNGTNTPSTADQILFLTSSGFRSFWLLKAGSYHQWNAAGDATLTSADATIIPPGTGVLLKTGSTVARSIVVTGQVRTTPFAQLVTQGYSLLTSPWPLDASPFSLRMTDTTVFTATTNPTTADTFQLWKGDNQPGASGYNGYWFFQPPNTPAIWTSSGDASLRSQNDLLLLKTARAAFLNRRSATTGVWVIPAP